MCLCPVHVVYVRHIMAAFSSLDGTGQQDVRLSRQEVTRALSRMFDSASQEVLDHVIEETCDVILRLFDGSEVRGLMSRYHVFFSLLQTISDCLCSCSRLRLRRCPPCLFRWRSSLCPLMLCSPSTEVTSSIPWLLIISRISVFCKSLVWVSPSE